MTETLDELGPVDWIVVEFPGPDFGKGQIAPFLEDLVQRDLVRVLDMVFLRKMEDGTLETAEISDLDPSELGEVRTAEADLAMVLSEQDVMDLATPPRCWSGKTSGRPLSARPSARPAANSWPAAGSRPRPSSPPSRPTPKTSPLKKR